MIFRSYFGSNIASLLVPAMQSVPSPTIYYPLSNVNDICVGGLNLTNTGTVTFVTGKVSNAASLSSTKTLTRANNASFEPTASGSWSMTFWLNWTFLYGTIMSKRTGPSDGWLGYLDNTSGDALQFYLYGNTTKLVSASITASTWTHFSLVMDRPNNLLRLYKNGAEVSNTSVSGFTYTTGSTQLLIGGNPSFLIDELGFFPATAISASDVSYFYNSGSGRTFNGTTWS